LACRGYECVIIMPDDGQFGPVALFISALCPAGLTRAPAFAVAMEKVHMLEALGAKVERVRPASIIDERQFVNLARSRALAFGQTVLTSLPDVVDVMAGGEDAAGPPTPAGSSARAVEGEGEKEVLRPSANGSDLDLSEVYGTLDGRGRRRVVDLAANGGADRGETYGETNESVASVKREADLVVSDRAAGLEGWKTGEAARGFFADQFENPANHAAHYTTTGPEIWRQLNGRLDAFVSGAGTGGTLSGVGRFLKEASSAGRTPVKVVLSDPEGSGLYNKVRGRPSQSIRALASFCSLSLSLLSHARARPADL
jgi:cysteine synthase A